MSFRPQITGLVERIDFASENGGTYTLDLVTGSNPNTGTVLASQVFTRPGGGPFPVEVVFDTPANVNAGTFYSFRITGTNVISLRSTTDAGDLYADGNAWQASSTAGTFTTLAGNFDLLFTTHVRVNNVCPLDITVDTDSGQCSANVDVPRPRIEMDPCAQSTALDFVVADTCVVDMGTAPIISQDTSFTIEAWVNLTAFQSQAEAQRQNAIYGEFNSGGSSTFNYLFVHSHGYAVFDQFPHHNSLSGSNQAMRSNNFAKLNEWNHIAFVRDGNTAYFYINGVLDTMRVGVEHPANIGNSTWIGGRNGTTNNLRYLDGKIDEFRIWDDARTAQEINDNYTKTLIENEAGLEVYYDFEDGIANGNNTSDTIVIDKTSNGNDGNLVGFSLNGSSSNYVDGPSIGYTLTNDFNGLSDASGNYPIGTTTVNWTLTDDSGNSTFCSMDVTVADNAIPTLGSYQIQVTDFNEDTSRQSYGEWQVFEVVDNMILNQIIAPAKVEGSTDMTLRVYQGNNISGTLLLEQNLGLYDGFTNPDTIDVTAGSILLTPGFYTVELFTEEGVNCCTPGQDMSWKNQFGVTGYPPSSFGGNTFMLEVLGSSCPTDLVVSTSVGSCSATVNYPTPFAFDNCSFIPNQTAGLSSGSTFDAGTIMNTYEFTDPSGNSISCSFNVTVEDNEAPVLTCASDTTVNVTIGQCSEAVTLNPPSILDNCGDLFGRAMNFDGVDDFVSVPNGGGLNDLQTGTIEMWIKWNGTNQDPSSWNVWGAVIGRQHNTNFSNQVIGLNGADPNTAKIVWRPYALGNNIISTISPGNDWNHVAIVYSSGNHEMFLNGASVGTSTVTGTMSNTSFIPMTIGGWIQGGGAYANADIDEVRIWNVQRSQAQLQANMNRPLTSETGLLSSFSFDEGIPGANNTAITTIINGTGGDNGTPGNMLLTGPTSNWVDGPNDVTLTNDAPVAFPTGNTTVTWTATDAVGNIGTCEQIVTVNPEPLSSCPMNGDISVDLDEYDTNGSVNHEVLISAEVDTNINPGDLVLRFTGDLPIQGDPTLSPSQSCDCPTGYAVIGYDAMDGCILDAFRLICANILPGGVVGTDTVMTCYSGPGNSGNPTGPKYAASGSLMVGAIVEYGDYVNPNPDVTTHLNIVGRIKTAMDILGENDNSVGAANITRIGPFTNACMPTSTTVTEYAPPGSVIVGMTVKTGVSWTSSVRFKFQRLEDIITPIYTIADVDNCGATVSWDNEIIDCGDIGTANITLTVTDDNGAENTCNFDIAVSGSNTCPNFTSESEIEVASRSLDNIQRNMTLYPNPANNVIILDIIGLSEDSNLKMFDFSGRLRYESIVTAGTSRFTMNVKDQNYDSGMYIIEMIIGDELFTQKVFIID